MGSSDNKQKPPANKQATPENRQKALDMALAFIEKQYGKGAIMKLGDPAAKIDIAVIPTGCAAIDEAIARQEQLIEKLGEYRKSVIHHAVTGKIDCMEA